MDIKKFAGQLKLPVLKIGNLKVRIPIIQGGMGVGISLSSLASAVANEGGVGVISTAGIGMQEVDFNRNFRQANKRALRRELKNARRMTDGIIGVNILGDGTDGNIVSGNYIGTDAGGTQDKGNSAHGVQISSSAQNNTIGPNNLIAHSGLSGVYVTGSATTGNTITENSIHSNGSLGIDLYDGGNGGISAPAVTVADDRFVSGTAVAGDTVEVFTGPDEEGKTYLATALTDGAGDWEVVGPFTFDTYVTATATDASGNTSEFSAQAAAGACYSVSLPLGVKNY